MQKPIELLAPAGKREALEAVISAGADAIYLGGKRFNMRLHRSDYNFTDDQLAGAVNLAHKHGVKLYVTVNNILSEAELDELYVYLEFLQKINIDAIIVQDLGIVHLARQMGLGLPLHASTMMNVHSVPMASELKDLGISRIVVSRDITVAQTKEIREKSGIEVEYFIHGDMCVSQSGQCYASGVLFGKSSNRGECMKPCRWKYALVEAQSGQTIGNIEDGHFLAMKDLCLLQHIPTLAQAGISSLKIEGRMRNAGYLKDIVSIYRRAIDAYLNSPSSYYTDTNDLEAIYKMRVRDFTTSLSFGMTQSKTFDYSGGRELLFLSRFAREDKITEDGLTDNPFANHELGFGQDGQTRSYPHPNMLQAANCGLHTVNSISHVEDRPRVNNSTTSTLCKSPLATSIRSRRPWISELPGHRPDKRKPLGICRNQKSLAAKVGTLGALKNAITAGVDYVYLSGEVSPMRGQGWTPALIKEAVGIAHSNGKRLGLGTPRITTTREIGDLRWMLEKVKGVGIDSILAHNLGTLRLARELGFKIIADFSFNVLNASSALLLNQLGADVITPSLESSFRDICEIASILPIDIECIVHGQIPFMVLEHCLPAMIVTDSNINGVCRQPCRYINYGLRDEKGSIRPIETDQYCRNHIFFATDLCVLPHISAFMMTEIKSFRIEAQYYDDALVGTIVKLYRKQMDMFDYDLQADYPLSMTDWHELTEKSPRRFSLGAYKHGVIHSRSTVEVIGSLNV